MLHSNATISSLHSLVDTYFQNYKSTLTSLSSKGWNEEDLKGKTYQHWKVMQYYNLLYLLCIIRLEYDKLKGKKNWSYFVSKYKLNDIKDCLACEGIKLDTALELFGFPTSDSGGVSYDEIETTLQIYGGDIDPALLTAKERLENPVICVNYIEAGIDPGIPEGEDQNFDTIRDPLEENDSDETVLVDV